MLTKNQKLVIEIGVGILVIMGAYALVKHQGVLEEKSKQSAIILKNTQDSLKTLVVKLDSTITLLDRTKSKVDTIWKTRTVYVASADSLHKIVDSLNILASSDSVQACKLTKQALEASESECLTLRKAVDSDSVAIKLQQRAMDSTSNAILVAKQTIANLNKDLKQATKPYVCSIILGIPCLSRTMSFILGIVSTFLAYMGLH